MCALCGTHKTYKWVQSNSIRSTSTLVVHWMISIQNKSAICYSVIASSPCSHIYIYLYLPSTCTNHYFYWDEIVSITLFTRSSTNHPEQFRSLDQNDSKILTINHTAQYGNQLFPLFYQSFLPLSQWRVRVSAYVLTKTWFFRSSPTFFLISPLLPCPICTLYASGQLDLYEEISLAHEYIETENERTLC